MGPRTIEGTWEEVARHAPELAGHRVRLTVLDTATRPPLMLDEALADIIEEAGRLASLSMPLRPPHRQECRRMTAGDRRA